METCRTCAKCDFSADNAQWMDLFHSERCQNQIQSIRMQLETWKLQIKQNDGLPQKICTDCFSKFCEMNAFRRECQEAQQVLKNIFVNIDSQSESRRDLDIAKILDESNLEESLRDSNSQDFTEFCNKFVNSNSLEVNDLFGKCHQSSSIRSTTNIVRNQYELNVGDNEKDEAAGLIEEADIIEYSEDVGSSDDNSVWIKNALVTNETVESANNTSTSTDRQFLESTENILYTSMRINNESQSQNAAIIEIMPSSVDCSNLVERSEDYTDVPSLAFECKYCYTAGHELGKYFNREEELLEHVAQAHDSINPYDCPHCDEKYPDAPSRTVHMKKVHVYKRFECDVCGKKYADRFNLRHHIEKYHSKAEYECQTCSKSFASQRSWKHHIRWHVPENHLKCSHCDRIFISERLMKTHELTHSGVRNSEYCTFCGKSFFHIKALRWHIYQNHGGEKPFKCALCAEGFENCKEKRLHMLEKHSNNLTAKEKSQCIICQKKCANEVDLRQHMRISHEDGGIPIVNKKRVLQNKKEKQFSGVFQCNECPQRFNLKSALARHSAMHSAEGRPHVCAECKKRFKRIPDLRWHMKTHSKEKPNVCDVCGKGFALKYVLTQHRKSHEALEKCFQCATCGRTYLFEKSLRLHERVHTGKTFYNCDLCSEKFVTHIKFLCHMRKIHGDQNNTQSLNENVEDIVGI